MLFLILIIFQISNKFANSSPYLQTNIGLFEGRSIDFGEKGKVDIFYGVPFADVPNRFDKPQSPLRSSANHSAKQPKPSCSQITISKAFERVISEDCLYLNLFKPANSNNKTPLLVFVHGGGYKTGTDSIHSLDYMAENYVTKGIIYVTVHYRLGIMGLASLGHPDFNGNFALWDVRQALLWLRENADNIGFDKKRITMWGYSAGSSIVSHLSLSTQSRDLFAQSIQMSGSCINEWSFSKLSIKSTLLVAQKVGCDIKGSGLDIKECLRKKSSEELYQAVETIQPVTASFLNTNKFTPVPDDGDFFQEDLMDLLKSSAPKPTLISLTENEALLFVIYDIFNTTFYLPQTERPLFDRFKFEQILRNHVILEEKFGNQVDNVIDQILEFYLPKSDKSYDYRHVINQYSKFISDILIVVPQMLETKQKIRNGWSLFQILTTHRENIERNFPKAEKYETTHGFEYSYLFNWPFVGDVNLTQTDLQFRDNLVNAIVNFVKFGTPNSPERFDFVQASPESPYLYTDVSVNLKSKDGLFKDNVIFWERLTEKYGYDLMRGQPTHIRHSEL